MTSKRTAAVVAATLGTAGLLATGALGWAQIARAQVNPMEHGASAALAPMAFQQPGPGAPGPGRDVRDPQQFMQRRLEDLRTALRLTPQQQPAWDRFAATLRDQGTRWGERMRELRAQGAPAKALDRLELAQRLGRERQASLQTVTEATRTFYDALSPEQKQTFDARFRLRSGRRFGPGRSHEFGPGRFRAAFEVEREVRPR